MNRIRVSTRVQGQVNEPDLPEVYSQNRSQINSYRVGSQVTITQIPQVLPFDDVVAHQRKDS